MALYKCNNGGSSVFNTIVGPYEYLHYAAGPANKPLCRAARGQWASGVEVDFNPDYSCPTAWIGVEGLSGTLTYRVVGDNPYWCVWGFTSDGNIVSLQEAGGAAIQQSIDDYEMIIITTYRYPGLGRFLFKIDVT